MRKRTEARECLLKILYQCEIHHEESCNDVRDRFWEDNPVDQEVSAFANALFDGMKDRLAELDAIITRHTDNWDLSRLAILDKNMLRIGTYELLFEDDIPPKVTINEAVNIAKKYSQEDSGKFVNGVLDHINHHEK